MAGNTSGSEKESKGKKTPPGSGKKKKKKGNVFAILQIFFTTYSLTAFSSFYQEILKFNLF